MNLENKMQNMSTDEYPKPPYAGAEEAFYPDPCVIQGTTMRRAMETQGRMFKQMTQWVPGLKYMYWDEDKQGTELWYKSARNKEATDDVVAYYRAIECLDERLMFVILRSSRLHRMSSTKGDSEVNVTDADQVELEWATQRLDIFNKTSEHRQLFIIPDWTTFGYPPWTLTVAMQKEMDKVLHTQHLAEGETLLYDRHRCALAWIRRDDAVYEIRSNYAWYD